MGLVEGYVTTSLTWKASPTPTEASPRWAAGWGSMHHLQPLCLYYVSCVCVSRVPWMFVMSTRVSHCMCYFCISVSLLNVCVSLREDVFSRSLSAGALSSWVISLKVCVSYSEWIFVNLLVCKFATDFSFADTFFMYLVIFFTHKQWTHADMFPLTPSHTHLFSCQHGHSLHTSTQAPPPINMGSCWKKG